MAVWISALKKSAVVSSSTPACRSARGSGVRGSGVRNRFRKLESVPDSRAPPEPAEQVIARQGGLEQAIPVLGEKRLDPRDADADGIVTARHDHGTGLERRPRREKFPPGFGSERFPRLWKELPLRGIGFNRDWQLCQSHAFRVYLTVELRVRYNPIYLYPKGPRPMEKSGGSLIGDPT
jgi:hypothetical protein